MACYDNKEILDFLTGRMPREEEVAFKSHIAKCGRCTIRRYDKEDELLSAYHKDAKCAGLI